MPAFDIGTAVVLHSLQSRPDLNGRIGVVEEAAVPDTGRILVCLTSGSHETSNNATGEPCFAVE